MKIISTADLHGTLPEIKEEVEILIIAGDICPYINESVSYQRTWLRDVFSNWVKELKISKCIIIGGNHDYFLEAYGNNDPAIYETFYRPSNGKIIYLQDKRFEYYSEDGGRYMIYGTPWVSYCGNMAFSGEGNNFEKIPEGLDILISHDTPRVPGLESLLISENYEPGNELLLEKILKIKPRYNFSGHIHKSSQSLLYGETIFQNVSGILKFTEINPRNP